MVIGAKQMGATQRIPSNGLFEGVQVMTPLVVFSLQDIWQFWGKSMFSEDPYIQSANSLSCLDMFGPENKRKSIRS